MLNADNKYLESLEITKKAIDYGHLIGDTALIARTKFSMTYIYDGLKEYEKSIEIHKELIEKYVKMFPPHFEVALYANLANAYYNIKDYKNSIENALKAYSINPNLPTLLCNLGDSYLAAYNDSSILMSTVLPKDLNLESSTENYTEEAARAKALVLIKKYFDRSLLLSEEINDNRELLHPHLGLGDYYDIIGDSKKTIYHYNKAWEYSKGANVTLKNQLRVANRLYELNKFKSNPSETLKWLEIRDSLEKVEYAQNDLAAIGKKQAEFEYSQKIYADSLDQKQKDLVIKLEQERQLIKLKSEEEKKYFLVGGLALLIIFLLVLFRRFKVAVKQRNLIELQKEAIETSRIALRNTHEGVKDSITYSKRIQTAVFPPLEMVKRLFPDSFLFFKPKDVVSGNFYWVYEFNNKKVIVTADCTGHGVPGAFMTIIGINILKEIFQEGIVDSGIVLKEINKRLIERLSQNGKDAVKDGMDLALCIFDEKTIEFVGAHLPLYHVRAGELFEYKGNNIFLGSKLEMDEPKVNYIPYQAGDLIYMSTDGFPDQKGGESGKKFYSKRLKQFLLDHSSLTMEEQEAKLIELRENWLSNTYEQLDDITIVGIKL